MKNLISFSLICTALWIICLFPKPSLAYIDPGSGFILLQVIIASAVGGFFVFKRFWIGLIKKLPFWKSDESTNNEENNQDI